MKFIVDYEYELDSMAALCRRHGISRKTAYKWLARWQVHGPAGLVDQSRAPHRHPQQVDEVCVAKLLELRDRYGWGPKKLLALLEREAPTMRRPAISTVEQILKDHERIGRRPRRRRVPPASQPLAHATSANAVWAVDFKGHFLTGQGQRCHPLTISDGYSRYLLCCQGLHHTGYETVWPIFELTFRQYGLPAAIRSDNGPPFASRAVAGLSRLSVWWIKLGIWPDRIVPGHPEQNGRHERMHLTLQQEAASPPADSFGRQQVRFDRFRQVFNEVRPHEALVMATPASCYVPSERSYPRRQPEMDYDEGWTVRRVQKRGEFYWAGRAVLLSEVLAGEPVGLQAIDERHWRVCFGPVVLGIFDSRAGRMLSAAAIRRRPALATAVPAARPSAALQAEPPGA
jgi:transposase InsO family protein